MESSGGEENKSNEHDKEDRLEDLVSMVGPTDITLVAGGEEIACHKKKLSESSSYFQAMFNSNMLESKAETVELKDVQAHLVRKLVQYCYSHELHLTDANVGDILSTASMYQFLPVIAECTQYLVTNLRVDNCLTAMLLADTCTINELYHEAKRLALWHFSEVVQHADFLNMSVDSLRDYLNNDMLTTSEMGIVRAVIRWTTFDGPSRSRHFASLLSQVRLTSMAQDELVEVGQLELVKSNPECVKLVEQNPTRTGEENEKVARFTNAFTLTSSSYVTEYCELTIHGCSRARTHAHTSMRARTHTHSHIQTRTRTRTHTQRQACALTHTHTYKRAHGHTHSGSG